MEETELDDEGEIVYNELYSDNGKYFINIGESTDTLIPVEIDTLDGLVSSHKYDVISGSVIENDTYPAFYDSEYDYLNLGNNVLVRLDGTVDPQRPEKIINTTGTLVVENVDDITDTSEETLTLYYFQDNNEQTTRIYPCLLVDDNSGLVSYKKEGCYNEVFNPILEPQITWTYDIPETQEVETLPYETFDQQYTNKALNLFESSSYHDEAIAVNDLYNDDESWNGNIQYEYYEYTNPLEYIEYKLNKNENLFVTLI